MKNKSILAIALFAVFGVLSALFPAQAQSTMGITATIVSSLAQIIIELVGKLLIVLIEILLAVVKYNDFINADAVKRGWILIRDFSNMAFLVIFIAIAFATILGVEKYEWKRLLPKLLIMAVVINFSKTICGILIDASQVVMITFVNGFKDVAAGNLIRGFGLSDMLSIRDLGADESVTDNAITAASILAVILLIIAAVVVGIIVIMFLIRILMLWMLIILSPIAFMLSAAPGGEAQFQKWFQKFIKYAFMGPLLAFFLWLSFSVMAGVSPGSNLAQQNNIQFGETKTGLLEPAGNTSAAISGISRSDQLLSYGIAIGLLIMSLMVAQSLGVAGSSLAGDALSKIKSGGVKLGKLTALAGLTGGAGLALGIAGKQAGKAGYDWMTKKDTLRGNLTRALGRKTDDKMSPALLRGVGKVGSKLLPGRLGQAAERLGKGEFGGKFRVIKQAWKDRSTQRESELTAEARGGMRDIINKGIDNKDTDYASRERNKLVAEAKKNIQETTDMSTSTLKNIANTGNIAEQKAAIQLLQEKTSLGDLIINEDTHKSAIAYVEQGTEQLEQRKNFLNSGGYSKETKEIEQRKKSILKGRNIEDLSDSEKKQYEKEDAKQKNLDSENTTIDNDIDANKEFVKDLRKNDAMDSPLHRWIYMRDKFGDTAQTAEFYSGVASIGRKNGETQLHGSVKYDADNKTYSPANFAIPKGRQEQMNSMAGRAAYQDTNETMKVDGMAFRNKVTDKDGEHFSKINQSGMVVLQKMAGNTDNRTVKQMSSATFAAMLGGDEVKKSIDIMKKAPDDQNGRDEIKKKFGDDLWRGFKEIGDLNILGQQDLSAIEVRLKNITGRDKLGNPVAPTAQSNSQVAATPTTPPAPAATPVPAQQQFEHSLDTIVSRIDALQDQRSQPNVDLSGLATTISSQLSSMTNRLKSIFGDLSDAQQKEAQSVSDRISGLADELKETANIGDEDDREDRINEIFDDMNTYQAGLNKILNQARQANANNTNQAI